MNILRNFVEFVLSSAKKIIIYHPNFVWYLETSSSGDINPMSYHLAAFELINQLLYVNFPSLKRKIVQKDLCLRCRRLLRCDFVTSVL